ncbi:MAG: tRNA preQ1(34) S-adenosylmethionine ribosyltransferase-isomerase QueA [Patescibacteria group bacterium]
MQTALFDYHLPEDRIAQEPMTPRDHSRLLVLDRETGEINHRRFFDIVDELDAGDLLIANESKVFKARLKGRLIDEGRSTGSPLRAVEVFLIRPDQDNDWIALAKPGKKLQVGDVVEFDGDGVGASAAADCAPMYVQATIKEKRDADGTIVLTFNKPPNEIVEWTDLVGSVPVPPYVKATPSNTSQYQTVYAKTVGSVAAPTAGFHFTPELIEKLKAKGIQFATVTLHVGLGTFRPVQTDDIDDHVMHEEWVSVPKEVRQRIKEVRASGHRAIAVGTTTVRALESNLDEGFTNIFIKPGYQFTWVDGLITNFHLPKSTLLVLISTFIGEHHSDPDKGRHIALAAYEEAIKQGYRFYSFGDAMLVK